MHIIYGNNIYRQEQELKKIISRSHVRPEYIDGAALTLDGLADIVRGNSLFSDTRLVVIRKLSEKPELFNKLVKWIDELTPDTSVVLIEDKLDKRTKAYKVLATRATLINAEAATERDASATERWLRELAKAHQVALTAEQCRQMVRRALVPGERPAVRIIDQMQLYQAVKALQGTAEVTDEILATVLPPAIDETVFDLLDMAARGDLDRITQVLSSLESMEDGYRAVALIFSQWSQLAMVAVLGGDSPQNAAAIGVHPYVAKKLYNISHSFSRQNIRTLTQLAATLDNDMKTSRVSPWDAVYRFLYAIASI